MSERVDPTCLPRRKPPANGLRVPCPPCRAGQGTGRQVAGRHLPRILGRGLVPSRIPTHRDIISRPLPQRTTLGRDLHTIRDPTRVSDQSRIQDQLQAQLVSLILPSNGSKKVRAKSDAKAPCEMRPNRLALSNVVSGKGIYRAL